MQRIALVGLCLACQSCGPSAPADSAPLELPVLGRGVSLERYTAEVAAVGNWAYTTTWGSRPGDGGAPPTVGNAVKIWDVSGNAPVLHDSLIITNAVTLGDVQISDDGRLLVVATHGTPGSIVIFDRTDPARPTQITRFLSPNMLEDVHTAKLGRVNGRLYAFMAAVPQLVIVDITTPTNPQEVFAGPLGESWVHDVFVRDDLLFACQWNGGLTVWDIGGGGRGGSPANPIELGNVVTVGGAVHNVLWFHDPVTSSKRYAFVGEEGYGAVGSASAGDIHVVDVSDFAHPREVAFFHADSAGPHNFSADEHGGFLYSAFYNGGVRVLDVRGDLGTCKESARAPDGRCDLALMGREAARGLRDVGAVYVWGVQRDGNSLYASDMLSGLFKLDLSALAR